jgi:hypothetical protein
VKEDISLANSVVSGDRNACKIFVNDYTDLVLSKVWDLMRTHCDYPAKEKICSLIILQKQRKGLMHHIENQCDECMESYIWFVDFL